MSRATCAFFMAAGLILTGACGAPAQEHAAAVTPRPPAPTSTSLATGDCAGFSLEIAPGVVGQASAVEAAQSFVAHGREPGYPDSGWQTAAHDEQGVSLTSGGAKLHVVQLPDKSWVVDQGWRC